MPPLQIVFLVASAATLVSGLLVVVSRNLIHAALWLIVTLFMVAVLFVLLEAGFLATVQVVLYIGAIAIMIIFAVMLTRRVMKDPGPQTNKQWWLAALVSLAIFAALAAILFQVPWTVTNASVSPDSLTDLGKSLVDTNRFVLPFEVASVLLIAALIGSIVIAGGRD
ncbi:MAG: NADH-quinone oxidoreductase subunit J [Chloroflexi bacterium]|nr:NADH-quinone oxidoreductase subunit J [Chloroflexota bacterium]